MKRRYITECRHYNKRHKGRCHRQVWYCSLSLRYACIRSLDIILIPQATSMQNFVSFTASTAELAHGEKSRTQSLTHSLSHPAYLMSQQQKPSLRNFTLVSHSYSYC